MRGEKTDENIRWSLGTHQKKWGDNLEEARASDSEEARDSVEARDVIQERRHLSLSPNPRDRRRDTMRDDLVEQGIIRTEANDTMAVESQTAIKRKDSTGLGDDMQKYGID